MSIEIGSAYISILPETRGLAPAIRRELGVVERDAGRSGDRAGKGFGSKFTGALGGLLKGGAFAAIGGASLLAGAGLKTAAELEQSRIGFETMLGSAKAADRFLGQIKSAAEKTPFELTGLTESSQKLLAFGFDVKDVIPTLTTLGDAAAGLGLGEEGLDRISTAVGQIQAKGKVQSEELLQLTDAGIPALKILANQYGVTAAEMQEQVTAGTVQAGKAIPALLKGIKNGSSGLAGETTRFGGLMAKQAGSVAGLFSTLKDKTLIGLADAIQPLMPMLKSGLGGAIKFVEPLMGGLATALTGLVSIFQGGAGNGIGRWVGMFSSIASGIGGVVSTAVGGKAGLSAWGDTLSSVGASLMRFVDAILPTLQSVGASIMGALGPGLRRIGEAIRTQLLPAFQRILPIVAPVAKFLIGIFGSALVGAIKGVVQAVKGIVGVISGVFNLIASLVEGDWKGAWEALKQIFSGAIDFVIGALKVWWNAGILGIFRGGIKWIVTRWKTFWAALKGFVKGAFSAIGKATSAGFKAVVKFFVNGVKTITAPWRRVFSLIGTLARAGWARARVIFSNAFTALKGALSKGIAVLTAPWRALWPRLKSVAQKGWDAIRDGISRAMTAAKSAFSKGVSGIRSTWEGIKSAASAPVRFVVDTVYNNGLRKMIGAIPGVGTPPFVSLGFSSGGYTGQGGKYEPAGIVHRDEFVVRKSSRRRFEKNHPGALDYLNAHGSLPGFAEGGLAGMTGSGKAKKKGGGVLAKAKKWLDAIKAIKSTLSGISLGSLAGDWGGYAKSAARSAGRGAVSWINGKLPNFGPIPDNPIPTGIFDNGGVLEPGALAYNASKRPEAVYNHRQFRAFADSFAERDAGPRRVDLVVGDRRFEAYLREVAADTYHGEDDFAGTVRRMR
ncbi:hypothetical protein GCM10009737_28230 [Nocardioides lentus]|uniref:Tape measure protein N-terminal domain-containing protein n=1 Tax=Nocardioides lentus TaxID=338077 RepID=A0ABP5AX75_9ACTN